MIAGREAPSEGVRLGVRTGGCSGMAYTLEFSDDSTEFDEKVEEKGVTVYIDPKALMFVVGTEMDYVEGGLESGFVFNNPNEKARCGCGESFHV
jgi:iron-sulfur cluster assembly protein